MTKQSDVDPTTLAVVMGALAQIVDEMDSIVVQAAFSPVISEQQDRASGVFDARTGEVVAQGLLTLPMFMTAMQFSVQEAIKEAESRGGFEPGDIYLMNNPYTGGTHLPDVKLFAPVFYDGSLVAILGVCGHWNDVGGSTPGGFAPGATEIFQEGLVINPVPLQRAGVMQTDLLEFIFDNVRVPEERRGDFQAVLSALHVGMKRMEELIDRYSVITVCNVFSELSDRSEHHIRSYLAEVPDGEYLFEDAIDNDGHRDEPLTIRLRVEVRGDQALFDFTGSSKPSVGPVNLPKTTCICACQIALKHLFPDVPVNGGCFRPFTYVIPEDTFLGVGFPHATSGYLETVGRVVSTVFGALSPALPEAAPADLFGTTGVLTFSGRRPTNAEYYLMMLPHAGGYGGSASSDGLVHGTTALGAANFPSIEALEQRIPIRVESMGLVEDSGGPGRSRGGLGTRYQYRLLAEEIAVAALGDRVEHTPFGVLGGAHGAGAGLEYTQNGERKTLPFISKGRVILGKGDTVVYTSPGGGGYGLPTEREAELVLADVRRGYVSRGEAEKSYGVVLIDEGSRGLSIDNGATQKARAELSATGGGKP